MRSQFPDVIEGDGLVLRRPMAADADALFATTIDPRVWAWMPTNKPTSPDDIAALIAKWELLRDSGKRVAYLVVIGNQIAGNITLYDFDETNNTIESGWTWIAPQYWGTDLNMRMKLALYDFAFSNLDVCRLAVRTDLLNIPAQNSLDRLGLTREGVLRKHLRRPDGSMRDTVYYSITDDEWPAISQRWRTQLAS